MVPLTIGSSTDLLFARSTMETLRLVISTFFLSLGVRRSILPGGGLGKSGRSVSETAQRLRAAERRHHLEKPRRRRPPGKRGARRLLSLLHI